jgi:hypothetical protein
MRHKKLFVIPFLLLGAVACGGNGSAAPFPSSAAAPVSAVTAQPLLQWYGQAAGPLGELGSAYTELGKSDAGSLADLKGTTAAADLENAARTGLAVPAPEGRPDLDQAYDRVMDDAVTVSTDITDGRSARFSSDADTAAVHLDALKTLLAQDLPST